MCSSAAGQGARSATRTSGRSVVTPTGSLPPAFTKYLFFHSSQEDVKSFHQDLPFDAVADPGKRYYRELGVEQSWAYAMHPRALWAAFRGMGSRFNLAMTGGPTGLPAEFLIAADGLIKAVKYGRHAYDQWSVEEVLELAKKSAFVWSSEPLMDGATMRR